MRTANPALNERVFRSAPRVASGDGVMTLEGTVNKSVIAVAITTAAAMWSFSNPQMAAFALPAAIIGFVVGIVGVFAKSWAPILTPIYALAEGIFLGAISLVFDTHYPGIAFQAVGLTFGTFFALLIAYKSKLIPVTQNFKLGIVAATGGIAVMYLISMIMSLFGSPVSFLHSSSPLSIGISIVIVIVAALNLVLDFDFIEEGSKSGNMPKYMEWYAAFGLLVTLVWLYVEILRLLAKLNDRR